MLDLKDGHIFYLTVLLIVLFSFFYTAIVFDADKIADGLKKQSGGTIPLIRAGKETSTFLDYVVKNNIWYSSIFSYFRNITEHLVWICIEYTCIIRWNKLINISRGSNRVNTKY